MSIASEIRDALHKTPNLTAGELMKACPSAKNSTQVSGALVVMIERREVIRTGDRGAYQHCLNDDYVPTGSGNGKKKRSSTRSAKKSQRTAAKLQRKTAVLAPAHVEPDDNYVVALQADGSVFLLDKADGTYQTLPGAVVQQIISLAGLVAR